MLLSISSFKKIVYSSRYRLNVRILKDIKTQVFKYYSNSMCEL